MLPRFVIRCGLFAACLAFAHALVLLLIANLPVPPSVLARTNRIAPLVGGVEAATFASLDSVRPPLDVLFAGSSHAQLAFDPRFFDHYGLSSFTLATPRQTPKNTYYLVRHYASQIQPKVFVLEVWWDDMATEGTEAATRLAMTLPLSRDMWDMLRAVPGPKPWNAALLRMADLSGRFSGRRMRSPYVARYQDRGFFAIPPGPGGNRRFAPRPIVMRADQLDYLRRTIRLMREQGTRVLLVVAPVPQATLHNILNLEELDRTMRALADEEGVRYVDFNKLMTPLDPLEHFNDFGHLTEPGAQRFMEAFVKELGGDIGVAR